MSRKKCKCKCEYRCGCGCGCGGCGGCGCGNCCGCGNGCMCKCMRPQMSNMCGMCGCGCNRPQGNSGGCSCCGFDPCRLALFLLVLKKACIIDHETGTLLVFLFLLCCGGFAKQGICC